MIITQDINCLSPDNNDIPLHGLKAIVEITWNYYSINIKSPYIVSITIRNS